MTGHHYTQTPVACLHEYGHVHVYTMLQNLSIAWDEHTHDNGIISLVPGSGCGSGFGPWYITRLLVKLRPMV